MSERITEEQAENEYSEYSSKVKESDVADIISKEKKVMDKANGPLAKLAEDLSLLFSIIKDYSKGTYRQIPWTAIAGIVGALVYVFSPIDLIPDAIPIVGLTDDAAVVTICLKAVDTELQKYKEWKKNQ